MCGDCVLEETAHFKMEGVACKRVVRWARFRVIPTGMAGHQGVVPKKHGGQQASGCLKTDVQIVPGNDDEA